MISYNKLIRDNIPKIIQKGDNSCIVEVLDEPRFMVELKKKLLEESKELSKASNRDEVINELADIQEVMDAIKLIYEISSDDVTRRQLEKAETNGKFEKRLYLVSVNEKHE